MNDDRRPTDWSDDRLAAAFRARADARLTPSDLSAATVDRIRRVPRISPIRDRFVRLGGVVAAAAVVAIAAVALVARPTTGPIGTAGPTTFGLPVLSVSGALLVRDGGVDDREVAVHGFLSGRMLMSCPFIPHSPNPTELRCADSFTWLMSAPESVVKRTSNSVTMHGPAGPALKPGLALVDTTGAISDSDVATPVLFIGHFDDRRAEFCAVDVRHTCADTFIVDRIDRGTLATVTFRDLARLDQPVQADSETDALIQRVDPSLRILSRRVVAIERLSSTEPVYSATPGGTPSYLSSAAWVVTALPPVDASGRAVARTFVIFDGTNIISEITRSGPAEVSLGQAPSQSPDTAPSATPSPTPSGNSNLAIVIGKPITMTEAIDHRDNDLNDAEMMVRGYGWAPSGPIACTVIQIAPPALDQCPDGYAWIGERKPVASGREFPQPDGPAFNLLIRPWTYMAFALWDQPREVLAVGHFDDARAAQCAPELVERCRRNFLVDAVLDPARGWPADNASSPSLSCADGLPVPDCAVAASAALESLGVNDGVPTEIEVGRGVWCPTPGLLFLNTSCPGGSLPPADGGQWIANALVTFRDSPAQAYLNIARSGTVVRAKSIALAAPPPSPN
jgi:hypothetical protein